MFVFDSGKTYEFAYNNVTKPSKLLCFINQIKFNMTREKETVGTVKYINANNVNIKNRYISKC